MNSAQARVGLVRGFCATRRPNMWCRIMSDLLHMVSVQQSSGGERVSVSMNVRKRNGDTEPVDVNKIVRAVRRWAGSLDDVDPMRVATRTISGLYDGATTAELDRLS